MPDQDIENVGAMLAAAQHIRSFVKGIDAETFANDVMRQKAVQGQIWLLSAAAKRVSERFKNHHSRIPWETLSRMGDSVVRSGDRGDTHTVFLFARKSVPELILMISGLVPKHEDVAD